MNEQEKKEEVTVTIDVRLDRWLTSEEIQQLTKSLEQSGISKITINQFPPEREPQDDEESEEKEPD